MKFQCSLDYRAFFECGQGTTGVWTGDNVEDGPHTFIIEGKDVMDNNGRHTHTWTQGMLIGYSDNPHKRTSLGNLFYIYNIFTSVFLSSVRSNCKVIYFLI